MTELHDAVDDLTLPRNVKIETDDGHTWATEDALLVQLREAVSSSLNSGSGAGGSPSTRNVLDGDALHKAAIITSQIGDWCRIIGATVTRDAVIDLRAWHAAFIGRNEPEEFYLAQMRAWAGQIRAMVVPPHRPIEVIGIECPDKALGLLSSTGETDSHTLRSWIDSFTREPITKCSCGLEWRGWQAARSLSYAAEMADQE